MRLIDADNFEVITDHRSIDFMHGVEFVFGLICDAPTVDAVPVVHAHWVPFNSSAAGDIQYCSRCGIGYEEKTDYCPRCGAKMDESVKE